MLKIKVFILHTEKDKELVRKIKNRLESDSIEVIHKIKNSENISSGNFISMLGEIIETVDFVVLLFPQEGVYTEKKYSQLELILSALTLAEYTSNKTIVIPIKRDAVQYFAKNGQLLVFGNDFETNYNYLLQRIRNLSTSKKDKDIIKNTNSQKVNEKYKTKLKETYEKGDLVLFCGAGVSLDAGIPSWGALLKSLLEDVFKNEKSPKINADFANLLQKKINVSPLIMAQYIKRLLSDNFIEKIRDALYEKCTDNNKIIDAISELSRQKRNKKPLKAIITFILNRD